MEESPQLATPGLSRRGLFRGGLVVGLGVAGLSVASAAVTAGIARASQNADIELAADYGTELTTEVQTLWQYCYFCRNLWYGGEGDGSAGICAAGYGGHSTGTTGSATNYGTVIDNPGFPADPPSGDNAYLQSPWLWCSNCACLYWGNGQSGSWCAQAAVNGSNSPGQPTRHSSSGSGVYYMPYGVESGGGAAWTAFKGATLQQGWKYCNLCKCLYWGNAAASSTCQYVEQNNPKNSPTTWQHAAGDTVYYVAMMS